VTSARTAQRLTRILAMLPWVIANPGATVDEVCRRFGYTEGELVGDLNLIFVCGLPGYGPGDLMDAYLLDDEVVIDMADYFATPLRLTPAEGLTLLASGMALLSTGQGSPELASAVDKLQRVLLPDDIDPIVVDLPDPALVAPLRDAANERRVVDIVYTGLASGETTERSIEPWSVFSTLGNWYVSAHCRLAGAERVFRVDRIRSAEVTDEHFDPPEQPPAPEIRYTPGVDDVRATIRLTPAARWVSEYYPVDVLETDDTGAVIRFSAADPAVAARLLVRLGGDAELLDGTEVRDAAAELRGRILRRYGAS
jgi:proteasome accessory factor C